VTPDPRDLDREIPPDGLDLEDFYTYSDRDAEETAPWVARFLDWLDREPGGAT